MEWNTWDGIGYEWMMVEVKVLVCLCEECYKALIGFECEFKKSLKKLAGVVVVYGIYNYGSVNEFGFD